MRCFCAHVKGRKKISLVLSLLIGFILIAGAALAVPVPVLAISAGGIKGTIASVILSMLLQCGVAPTNTSWLASLNNAYGVTSTFGTIENCISSGLLSEVNGTLIDTGLSAAIEGTTEYTSLGLAEMFTTTSADAAVAEGLTVASGGSNIATAAINCGTLGTIGAFAGAAAVGVGLGVLANKIYNHIKDYVQFGLPMNETSKLALLQNIPSGYNTSGYCDRIVDNRYNIVEYNFYNDSDHIWVTYPNSSGGFSGKIFSKLAGNRFTSKSIIYNNSTLQSENDNASTGVQITLNSRIQLLKFFNTYNFSSEQEANNYGNAWLNGTVNPIRPISPDIITPQGNAQMVPGENGNEIINGLGNVLPEGYTMAPIDFTEYQDYVDNANQNTENGLTGEDTQGTDFVDFVTPYMVPYEELLPDPEPDEPLIPEYPDEIPEYPDRPVTPDQPTIPDKPDIPTEDIETNLDLTTTPDLRGIFPFCIPWDIYNLLLIFDTGENRQAPHITFTFPGTDWVIDVDLSEFDPVAGLLRILELILFIVGLMVATRSLIGAGG